jgi:hypothetical protein
MGDMYNRGGGALTPTSLTTTADVEVGGDLTVNGTTTTISTTNTVVSDKLIELANGTSTGADSGIIIERGSTGNNAAIIWDESIDSFVVGTTTATGASTGNLTVTDGALKAGSLDISGNADIDGTLEADAYTVNGVALDEFIADTVGAMVGSNTETGITVTYEDGDNTLDFALAQVTTNGIGDDQVTLDKMAGLARGKIIYGDASGNPAALAAGSNNQVLTSDGTDISWQNAAAGGATLDLNLILHTQVFGR